MPPPVVAPGLSSRLQAVTEQVWGPAVESGDAAVVLGRVAPAGWAALECYRVVPTVERAAMILPAAAHAVTAGPLLSHGGLRTRRVNSQRWVLGQVARVGGLVGFPRLTVLGRIGPGGLPELPVARFARDVGMSILYASIAVNVSSNRKPTLQLVDARGRSVAFAKIGWDGPSAAAIRRETEALQAVVDASGGPLRAPSLLADGEIFGRPYVVTSPVPSGSAKVRTDPTPAEAFALCPVVRADRAEGTRQFAAVQARLRELRGDDETGLVDAALDLLRAVSTRERRMPVARRWHGDFSRWNMARESSGPLWCWDWESSEPDALAGMDSLHWHVADMALKGEKWNGAALARAMAAAQLSMVAVGVPPQAMADVAAVYAATLTERAMRLVRSSGWEPGWVQPKDLRSLLAFARSQLD